MIYETNNFTTNTYYSRYYESSKLVTERTFIKSNIKKDLTTVQKMIVFKFIYNLTNTVII